MLILVSTGEVSRNSAVIGGKRRKLWYGLNSHFVILLICLDPNAAVTYRTSCRYCRPSTHKRINDNPFPQG